MVLATATAFWTPGIPDDHSGGVLESRDSIELFDGRERVGLPDVTQVAGALAE